MQSELEGQIPADTNKRGFEGIWIPAEIWLDTNLSALERILYAEIASFGKNGCWKKSEELMKLLGVSKGTFQKYCRNLRERGYIDEKRAFGRIIRTTTLGFRPPEQELHQPKNYAVQQHNHCAVHKEYTKEYITKVIDSRPVEKSQQVPKEYGNKDVNELFAYWKERVGIAPSNNPANRRSCSTLIRQRGMDGAKKVVDAVHKSLISQDKFAPRVSSFSDLYGAYGKLPKLDAWIIKNSPKTALKRFQTANTANYEPSDAERAETLKRMQEARKKLFN